MRIMTNIKQILLFVCVMIVSAGVFAQEADSTSLVVTGTVFDAETHKPLEFVAIDNSDIASTFSDLEGNYEIEVKSYYNVLKVAFMGYQTKEVVLAGRTHVDIYLTPIGYATFQEHANLFYTQPKLAYSTQAIENMSFGHSFENANEKGLVSAESVFKNQLAGVEVLNRSGMPGEGSDLFIRGFSSLHGNNRPLIVVDGMIYDDQEYGTSTIWGHRNNGLSSIDVSDIENVTVVKDAASIYGAKAANGVIYIRTRRATEQSNKIELNMSGGINMKTNSLPVLGADDYRLYLNDMLVSTGISQDSIERLPYMINNTSYEDYYRYHNNKEWQEELFANSYNRKIGMRITGGDDVALYSLSVNYLKNEGTVKETDYSRFNMRFNSDIEISKVFNVNSSISFARGVQNFKSGRTMTGKDNPFYTSLIKAPFLHPYVRTSTGIVTPVYEDYDVFGVSNPGTLMTNTNGMNQVAKNYRVFGSFNINAIVNENLTISNLVGIAFNKERELFFVPAAGVQPTINDLGEILNENGYRTQKQYNINNDLRLNYTNTFNRVHDFNAIAGVRYSMNQVEEDWGTGANTASDQITSVGQGDPLFSEGGGFLSDWNTLTSYASVNYGYLKKYYLSASVSLDAATQFGSEADGIKIGDNVFGLFPSVSGAWVLSSEPFLSDVSFIDLFKIRASYGLTGNDDIGLYNRYKYYTAKNYLGQQGVIRGNIYNPWIKWEKNTKINAGIDLELLHSRLTVSADVYQNETTDMIEQKVASVFSGEDNYSFNNGSFTTQGIDVSVNARILNGPVKWDLGIALSKYKTEVTKLHGDQLETELYGATVLTKVGESVGVFYGYETNGVYATTEAAQASGLANYLPNTDIVAFGAGDVIFVDHHADNVEGEEYTSIIDENDRVIIGDPTPDLAGGIQTRLNYKDFTLIANLGFSLGNDVFNALRYEMESMDSFNNQTEIVRNRWRYEGQVTDIPKAVYGDPMMNNRFSDRWIEDGSYLRLTNITLSYKLPLSTGFLDKPELFVTGNNLLTLTGYKGMDPDFSISNSALSRGIDVGLPPAVKSVLIGIKLKL